MYGDSGYVGADKREDATVRNKQGKKIKYTINRRPSQIKNLSKSGRYQTKMQSTRNPQSEQKLNTFSLLSREYLGIKKNDINGYENRPTN